MERTETDVDRFLADIPGPRGEHLRELDGLIAEELSGLERVLWTGVMWGGTDQRIVGYGAITRPRPRGAAVEWFLVGLAAQQRHLSLYVNAAEDGEYLVRRRAPELGRVKVGAAAITFSEPADLELDALRALLRRARELSPEVS